MRPLAIIVAAIGMSGCTTSAPGSWQKKGADEQTITRDTSTLAHSRLRCG